MTERRPLPEREGWLAAPKTQLNYIRREQRVSQADLAAITGISLRNLSRLENGEMTNPPLRYLVNCARALGVPWQQLVEPEWEQWEPELRPGKPLPERRAQPNANVPPL
ncbi:MAG: helix-turn-helix transcriptional regulator [Acidimicrobiales bacterium]|nr:helix-turn-helix transcriptional regulator [Acidimicrobiales bacterium]